MDSATTTVVHLRRQGGQVVQGCDVYIGRQVVRGGWNLPLSKWANPYSVAACGSYDEAVRRYEAYLHTRPDLLADISELRGQVLGCWCKPHPCHGDVLAKLANQ